MNEYNLQLKNSFNSWSQSYESETIPKLVARGYSYCELGKRIAGFIKTINKENITILELGVGTGVLGANVVEALNCNYELIGLDISEGMIDIANKKNIYNSIHCSSADDYNYDTNVDCIFTGFMFHSILNQVMLLQKLEKCINNNGLFILIDLIPENKYDNSYLREHSSKYEYGAPQNYKTNQELLSYFFETNLELVYLEKLGYEKEFNHYMYVLKKKAKGE